MERGVRLPRAVLANNPERAIGPPAAPTEPALRWLRKARKGPVLVGGWLGVCSLTLGGCNQAHGTHHPPKGSRDVRIGANTSAPVFDAPSLETLFVLTQAAMEGSLALGDALVLSSDLVGPIHGSIEEMGDTGSLLKGSLLVPQDATGTPVDCTFESEVKVSPESGQVAVTLGLEVPRLWLDAARTYDDEVGTTFLSFYARLQDGEIEAYTFLVEARPGVTHSLQNRLEPNRLLKRGASLRWKDAQVLWQPIHFTLEPTPGGAPDWVTTSGQPVEAEHPARLLASCAEQRQALAGSLLDLASLQSRTGKESR